MSSIKLELGTYCQKVSSPFIHGRLSSNTSGSTFNHLLVAIPMAPVVENDAIWKTSKRIFEVSTGDIHLPQSASDTKPEV